ncbi:MAG TPA: DUF1638 domain-containing protein [Bacillota bacterium]|nr:DUF1638 domain-containing protein [Bacillota bacterium]
MHFKLIACEVITRELCYVVARAPHTIDLVFTPKGAHDDCAALRQRIQGEIDLTEQAEQSYDAVLLGYGLCGNATAGLRARRSPLVIPRAHDCCTLFLGSRRRYEEIFSPNPSMAFSSAGYCERGGEHWRASSLRKALGLEESWESCVEKYGEDNAKYLFETLSPYFQDRSEDLIYIDVPESRHLGWAEKLRIRAAEEGKRFLQYEGSIRLIEDLVFGRWNPGAFLQIQPGQAIEGVYDWDEIVRAVDEG